MLGRGGGVIPAGTPFGVADMGYTEVMVVDGLNAVWVDPNRDMSPDLRLGRSSL